jgi:uncharacterized membrane protein
LRESWREELKVYLAPTVLPEDAGLRGARPPLASVGWCTLFQYGRYMFKAVGYGCGFVFIGWIIWNVTPLIFYILAVLFVLLIPQLASDLMTRRKSRNASTAGDSPER